MMVVIGNRFGFLVPPFVLLSVAGVCAVADAHFGAGYSEKHAWVWGIGLLPAAVVCWLLGRFLRGRRSALEDNMKAGSEPKVGSASYARYAMREIEKEAAFNSPPDSFFFLALHLWGPILAVIGIIVVLADWLGLMKLGS